MYAAVINVIQNVTRTACTESSPWTGATRKLIFGGITSSTEKLLPRSLGVIVNLAPRFRNNVNKRFECTRGCTRRAGLLPVYLRPPALVYANRLTGSIYVGTINPRRPRGIIFWGCKSTRSARAPNTAECFLILRRMWEKERGKNKKKKKISRDRLVLRSGVSGSDIKETRRAHAENKSHEKTPRGKVGNYTITLPRRRVQAHSRFLRWNWIHEKICPIIIARLYLEIIRSAKIRGDFRSRSRGSLCR